MTRVSDAHGMHPLRELIAVERALAIIASKVAPIGRSEEVELRLAAGRVVVDAVRARDDSPALDRSRMDGFALSSADLAKASAGAPVRLRVAGRALAGAPLAAPLAPSTCVEIATGAPLPQGADAVVPVEQTRAAGVTGAVEFAGPAQRGQFVSARGSDYRAGDVLVPAGTRLTPAKIAAAASAGLGTLGVRAAARVAIAATGDEVAQVGTPLKEGHVRESNSHALASLVAARGGVPVLRPIVPDSLNEVRSAVSSAVGFDASVFTGGSSAGAKDFLAEAVAHEGAVEFHGVALRPGKPVVFGMVGGRPVLGLPGNPTSCMVGAHLFLEPILAGLSGAGPAPQAPVPAKLAGDVDAYVRASPPGFLTLVLVRLEGGRAHPVLRDSMTVTGAAVADGYVEVAPGASAPKVGDEVGVVIMR